MCLPYQRRASNDGVETALWTYRVTGGAHVTETIDKSWVVSYSPTLSIMSQFHLNVEMCLSCIDGIKYIFSSTCAKETVVFLSRWFQVKKRTIKLDNFNMLISSAYLKRSGDYFNSRSSVKTSTCYRPRCSSRLLSHGAVLRSATGPRNSANKARNQGYQVVCGKRQVARCSSYPLRRFLFSFYLK